MKPSLKIPPLFWAITVFGLLWFAMRAFDYVMIAFKVAFCTELMTPEQHQWIDTRPMWFCMAWPLSVWSSLPGALLLLLHRHAVGLFRGSLPGFVVAVLWGYLSPSANLAHMQSWTTHTFNVAILISILSYLNYAWRQVETGLLR
jgi:hypothetical protein